MLLAIPPTMIILSNLGIKFFIIPIFVEIFETSKNQSCTITYPEDVLVGKNIDDKSQTKELKDIADDDLILDIGPKTINKIINIIENSETVLWNGPAGYFENPNFAPSL